MSSEVDLEQIQADRMRQGSFSDPRHEVQDKLSFRRIRFELPRSGGPAGCRQWPMGCHLFRAARDQLRGAAKKSF